MVILMKITLMSILMLSIWLGIECWYLGADYVINGRVGRRLNPAEKWFSGFNKLLQI